MPASIRVGPEDFSLDRETALLCRSGGAGAVAHFVGIVRSDPARPLAALELEHYPGMTEAAIAAVAAEAERRWSLLGCTVIHRVGRLAPGEKIVLAAAAAGHRQAALMAVSFLIDWLKTRAPFWKKEIFADGHEAWVEARAADDVAAARWLTS